MINFAVAYDDKAGELSDYFTECKNDLVGFLNEQENKYNCKDFQVNSYPNRDTRNYIFEINFVTRALELSNLYTI